MRNIICIFIGGGTGSILRYLLQMAINHGVITRFPLGTFGVNIIGCFLIGVFYALSERYDFSNETHLLLTVGLCGGFTTFSTFSNDSLHLLKEELYGVFAAYTLLSITVGILGTFAGIWLVRNL